MPDINIRVNNQSCIVDPCETPVERERSVSFILDDLANDLRTVRVIIPGNVLCVDGRNVTQFELTPGDPQRDFTVCRDSPRGKQPINAVAQFQNGASQNGRCGTRGLEHHAGTLAAAGSMIAPDPSAGGLMLGTAQSAGATGAFAGGGRFQAEAALMSSGTSRTPSMIVQ